MFFVACLIGICAVAEDLIAGKSNRRTAAPTGDLQQTQIQCGSELARDGDPADAIALSIKQKRQPQWAAVFFTAA